MNADASAPTASSSARSGESCCDHDAREQTAATRPPLAAEKPTADGKAAATPQTERAQTAGAKSKGSCGG